MDNVFEKALWLSINQYPQSTPGSVLKQHPNQYLVNTQLTLDQQSVNVSVWTDSYASIEK